MAARSRRVAPAVLGAPVGIAIALAPLLFSEVTVFRAGLVVIFLVSAMGLHVLVNWVGELSLAHAGITALPAFVVLATSEVHGVSPIYLLPLGILTGALAGAVVALPTLRAKGVRVALVTLAAGIAIDRYFLTQTWLVGPVGARKAVTPSIGPVDFVTSRSLYLLLLAVLAVALVATWVVFHSKVARSWFWVRSDPAAAAVFGIPVARYRILGYASGGALAGLAGGLLVVWVQRLSPQAFPTTLSFSYLLVAVLAGPGFVWGAVVATLITEGGRQFLLFSGWVDTALDVLGPIALIYNVTAFEAGFNGVGRIATARLLSRRPADGHQGAPPRPFNEYSTDETAANLTSPLVAGNVE